MRIGTYTLDIKKPAIMGIVNVTPDSFSDGGKFISKEKAFAHALKLEEEGADIIDIGGESTRPGANIVSQAEELERVIPVIAAIRRRSKIPISIDTTKSLVAKEAIDNGADMINDISAGRFDPAMIPLAAKLRVPICLMHMKGKPDNMQMDPHYIDLITEIHTFFEESIRIAVTAGVEISNIIIDPGIGFGKTTEDNVRLIKGLDRFTDLNVPILIGTSRKSFIGKLLGLEVNERLEASLASLAVSVKKGAQILRVHDVQPTKRFLDTLSLFAN